MSEGPYLCIRDIKSNNFTYRYHPLSGISKIVFDKLVPHIPSVLIWIILENICSYRTLHIEIGSETKTFKSLIKSFKKLNHNLEFSISYTIPQKKKTPQKIINNGMLIKTNNSDSIGKFAPNGFNIVYAPTTLNIFISLKEEFFDTFNCANGENYCFSVHASGMTRKLNRNCNTNLVTFHQELGSKNITFTAIQRSVIGIHSDKVVSGIFTITPPKIVLDIPRLLDFDARVNCSSSDIFNFVDNISKKQDVIISCIDNVFTIDSTSKFNNPKYALNLDNELFDMSNIAVKNTHKIMDILAACHGKIFDKNMTFLIKNGQLCVTYKIRNKGDIYYAISCI